MVKDISRKVALCAALLALGSSTAFASPTGTDPEPGIVHVILVFLGLA
jgi:hypothetical protein